MWKKNLSLFRLYRGLYNYPVMWRFWKKPFNKDSYLTTRIQWNARPGFFRGSTPPSDSDHLSVLNICTVTRGAFSPYNVACRSGDPEHLIGASEGEHGADELEHIFSYMLSLPNPSQMVFWVGFCPNTYLQCVWKPRDNYGSGKCVFFQYITSITMFHFHV